MQPREARVVATLSNLFPHHVRVRENQQFLTLSRQVPPSKSCQCDLRDGIPLKCSNFSIKTQVDNPIALKPQACDIFVRQNSENSCKI